MGASGRLLREVSEAEPDGGVEAGGWKFGLEQQRPSACRRIQSGGLHSQGGLSGSVDRIPERAGVGSEVLLGWARGRRAGVFQRCEVRRRPSRAGFKVEQSEARLEAGKRGADG